MGLFSFTQELAMDLGTANTIITWNDKIVVDEPSVIALDARSEKVLAIGRQAREMYEKTNPNIRTIRPLREGVIADFYAAEQMMRGLIKMANGKKRWFAPSLRMVIGIPSGSTEVEIRAVRDSAEHGKDHSAFIGFAPYNNPKVAICVYVENGGFGAKFGVPIGKLMMEKYLKGEIPESDKYLEEEMSNAVVSPNVLSLPERNSDDDI